MSRPDGNDSDGEQPRKKARLTGPDDLVDAVEAQRAQEEKAGISVFASEATGFTATVKQRFTDFMVNEILPDGTVCHLEEIPTVTKKPKPERRPASASEPAPPPASDAALAPAPASESGAQSTDAAESTTAAAVAPSNIISDDQRATLHTIFGETTTAAIVSLYAEILANPKGKPRDFQPFSSQPVEDKQARTNAHVAVRQIFGGKIDTVTANNNTITVQAAPYTKHVRSTQAGGNGARPKGKVGWEELGGEHLHFTLYKENKDTMEVIHFAGNQIKVPPKSFQFAGTKDRRGVTAQRVSAFRVQADRLASLNPKMPAAKVGGFKYLPHALELGDLQGNEFTITLRNCRFGGLEDAASQLDRVKELLTPAMDGFRTRGFINYYGLQRFGSFSISTDTIGLRLLQNDLQGAIDDILDISPQALEAVNNPDKGLKVGQDDLARAEALHIWKTTKNTKEALDKLPKRFQAESALIRFLGFVDKKTGQRLQENNLQGALMNIPRNLRLMYAHAYQSLVWNVAAGKRWQLYGEKVVEGDLVISNRSNKAAESEETVDDAGEVIIRPDANDSATATVDKFERARPLTKDEAESGQFSIFDIVLPLPGYDVDYPSNEVGQFYVDFMASERGGGLNPRDMRRKWKDVSLTGGYRKIMSLPKNVSWEVHAYADEHEQFVQTDLERVQGAPAPATNEGAETKDKVAIVLRMQLDSGQYATMALRELSKGGATTFVPDFSGR